MQEGQRFRDGDDDVQSEERRCSTTLKLCEEIPSGAVLEDHESGAISTQLRGVHFDDVRMKPSVG
jgi:hypothetical protein